MTYQKKEERPASHSPLVNTCLDSSKFYSNCHRAAVFYISLGLYVLPVIRGEKRPLTKSGFKDASIDKNQIDLWWKRNLNANVGIATGQSSKIITLDFDSKPGYPAEEALSNFELEFGKLPDTPYSLTGGGGMQFFYASNSDICSRIGFRKQVDIKANGGYVVAPPSLHPSGRRYLWDAAFHPTTMPITKLPSHIEEALKVTKKLEPKEVTHWVQLMRGVQSGYRNKSAAEFAGYLFRRKIHKEVVEAILKDWNNKNTPPLIDQELFTVINNIYKLSKEIGA